MNEANDIELIEIIADALHHSGPSMNPERQDMMHARLRANVIVQALRREGLAFARGGLAPPAVVEKPRRA
jgi:hypothetical protein